MIRKVIVCIVIAMAVFANMKSFSRQSSIPEQYRGLGAEEINKMGLTFHGQGNYVKSLELFHYAVEKDGSYHIGWFNIACANSLLGRNADAIAALKKAMKINRDWVEKNKGDSDLKGIRNLPEFRELFASGGKTSRRWEASAPSLVKDSRYEIKHMAFDPAGNLWSICFEPSLGDYKVIQVFRLENGVWQRVGKSIQCWSVKYAIMTFTSGGTPFIGYVDWTGGNEKYNQFVRVVTLAGGDWKTVGANFYDVNRFSLVMDRRDIPHLACWWFSWAVCAPAKIVRFAGGAWETLPARAMPGDARNFVMAFDPAGGLYGAVSGSDQVMVLKYTGSSWMMLGSAIRTGISSTSLALAFDPAGVPYLAFNDSTAGGRARVKKYTGGDWQDADGGFPGRDEAVDIFLLTDPRGVPWCACKEKFVAHVETTGEYAGRRTESFRSWIRYLEGTAWRSAGSQEFMEERLINGFILDPSGAPCVYDGEMLYCLK